MTQYELGLRSGIQFYLNILRARDQAIAQRAAATRALPLERLFDIQRQIEVLRSEVQDLVLQVTEAQVNTMDNTAQDNNDQLEQTTAAPAETETRSEERTANEAMNSQEEAASDDITEQVPNTAREHSVADEREPVEEPLSTTQASDASASASQEVQGGDEERENDADDEDSVAERIRRRRLQFLERNNRL